MTGAASCRPAGRLPLRVRVMRAMSARGLPKPVCSVAVQPRIAVPASDGVTLLADHYLPMADGPRPTLLPLIDAYQPAFGGRNELFEK